MTGAPEEGEGIVQDLPIALIGAGPMGLACAKVLVEQGIAFQGFELHSDVGGLWDIAGPRSTMYDSAHLISSRTKTEFRDFPMDPGVADYPSHRVLKDYFHAFADRFDLRRHYRFGAEVLRCEPLDAGWRVVWRQDGAEHEGRFGGVMIANGTLSEPNMPAFVGDFAGELIHSAQYRHHDQMRGKRVLVIGGGNSGCDIVVDAVHHGECADLSLRRGYHFVPKYVFGKPADTLGRLPLPMALKRRVDGMILRWFAGDPQRVGFPAPDHKLYESHPVVNSLAIFHAGHGDIRVRPDIARFDGQTVHFKDGTQADYDLVIAATGYLLHYPFIDRALLNWQGAAPHLFLNCLHPEDKVEAIRELGEAGHKVAMVGAGKQVVQGVGHSEVLSSVGERYLSPAGRGSSKRGARPRSGATRSMMRPAVGAAFWEATEPLSPAFGSSSVTIKAYCGLS